jgi:hypothetical protein
MSLACAGDASRADFPRDPPTRAGAVRTGDLMKVVHTCVGIAALIGTLASPALADIRDYEFRLVQGEMKKGDGAVVAVRLLNKKTGQPVPDAVIFAKRIDMAPDNMASMDAPLEPLPSTEAGVYRFKTNLMMQGRWQLSLGARIQGETAPLESKLVLRALP